MRTHSRELRIHEPKHEFLFCDDRKWRFDFAWPGVKIAIEVEGGAFGTKDRFGRFHRGEAGRHNRGAGFLADMQKYNRATVEGWRVLRFTPEQIERGQWRDPVIALISAS